MKTLRKGDNGAEVEILQHLLTYRNYKVAVDGDFGDKTEKAVINFQSNNFDHNGHSLIPDGIVGPITWRSLLESDQVSTDIPKPPVDPITLKRIDTIHPQLTNELKEIYEEIRSRGVRVRFTQVFRTFQEQELLYAKGRTAPGKIVTNARGGQSYHNYGLAVDIVLLTHDGGVSWDRKMDFDGDRMSDWEEIVFVFKHYGWKWGGDWTGFRDYPHFEKNFGFSTRELKDRYHAGKFEQKPYVLLV